MAAQNVQFHRETTRPTTSALEGRNTDADKDGAKILVVDDTSTIRALLERTLSREGYQVTTMENGGQAIEELSRNTYDLLLSDISMPVFNGIELLKVARELYPTMPAVLLTGNASLDSAMKAVEFGAFQYLTKPFEPSSLLDVCEQAVSYSQRLRRAEEKLAREEQESSESGGLSEALDTALSSLFLAFQPIFSARNPDERIGYEALMRTECSSLPHPGAILDAAERLGRLQELGRRIRKLAAKAAAEMADDERLFVNLHPEDLNDPVLGTDKDPLTAVAPKVVLEITERAAVGDLSVARTRVKSLSERGFLIAVDDLGTGYAGLTAFAKLQPDLVKLDMSLIRDIDKDPIQQNVVRSMVDLARGLDIEVVAEGVETQEELSVVASLGANHVQGFLLGRPGPR